MNRQPSNALHSLAQKLEFFDALIVIYITAFVREYLWILQNDIHAWILTIVISAALSAAYVVSKHAPAEKRPLAFWLIVALPLSFIYILRVGYPDLSFDVLNYHIFHSERALRGLLHVPGDFAPSAFPFLNNPVADMITGIFRNLFGFRFGTVINYLVLLWTGAILFKIFRHDIQNPNWRSVAVLLVLFSEQLLSEINNYMVDLLALPLLLEATYLALRDEKHTEVRHLIAISALLGASAALKLTNLVFALPIGVVAVARLIWSWRPKMMIALPAMFLAYLLPLVPHASYLYWLTSNPIFPLYNRLFRSPYWVNENVLDNRWGPQGAWETILWPIKMLSRQDRVTELNVYSGRVALGFVAAVLLLLFARGLRAKVLALVTVTSTVLWSLGTGYIRYGLFLEVLAGLCVVILVIHLWHSNLEPRGVRQGLAAIVCLGLMIQVALACAYTFHSEWGDRPTAFQHPREYAEEMAQLFRDRSLSRYFTSDEAKIFDGVGAWVETSYKTSALAAMLNPRIPSLNLFNESFASTPAALRRFRAARKVIEKEKMLSMTFADDFDGAIARLKSRGFAARKTTSVQLPYFSTQGRLPLVVIEIGPAPAGNTVGIFNAQLTVLQGISTMKVGENASVTVRIRNMSGGVWSRSGTNGAQQVTFGNKWLDESGRIVVNDDGRTPLPQDISPGSEIELVLPIHAPEKPGQYILMLDLVQEQVAWFYEKGSNPVEMPVAINP